MNLDGCMVLIIFFVALNRDYTNGEVLDSGTKYIPIGTSFHLKCQNKVPGRFESVSWRSSAYSKGKHEVYTYYKDQKKEVLYPSFKGRLKRYGGTSLHVHNAQPDDSGNWECNILYYYKNENDEERRKVTVPAVYDVIVVSPPTISRIYPELVARPSGYQATSFCEAHGLSPFNLTWSREHGRMSRYVKSNIEESMKGKYFSKRTYIKFEKLSYRDIGNYRCIADNMAGIAVRRVKVKIQVRPKITSQDKFVIHEGDAGTLTCNATGFPKVTFDWKFIFKHQYVTLRSGETQGRFRLSKTVYVTNEHATYAVSTLHIRNVRREDWGTFKCHAESEIGWDRKDIRLIGYSLPTPPKFITSNQKYHDQADLNWELSDDGGSPIHSITVQYKPQLDDIWTTIQVSKPILQYTLTNLEPNTIYDCRVLSTNNVGDSRFSEIFQVKTNRKKPIIIHDNQTIGELSIISFIGVCGAALVALTCAIGCICLYFQEKRLNRYQVTRQDSRGAGYQSAVSNAN